MTTEWSRAAADEIEAMPDPAERARLATRLLASYQTAVVDLARIRRRAIAELRAEGHSYGKLADELGLTRGRIAQLQSGENLAAQAFFGGLAVTIITPLRAGVDRPVVAQEDFEAASRLARFLDASDVETSFAQVSTDGVIDLSPAAVVAICGPKSSSTIADAMAADPVLAFEDDGGRWTLIDQRSGDRYGSPMDASDTTQGDLAYVARLPRPDRDGQFVSIAGIHAIGSLGAVAWLTDPANIGALHADVGDHPFSMIIKSEFTRDPLAITSTRVVVEPTVHE